MESQGVGVWASAGCVQAESRWLSFFFFFISFSKRVLSKTNKDITETANHKKKILCSSMNAKHVSKLMINFNFPKII